MTYYHYYAKTYCTACDPVKQDHYGFIEVEKPISHPYDYEEVVEQLKEKHMPTQYRCAEFTLINLSRLN